MTDYHSIDALSNSSLSVLKRSPTEFHARFIAKTLRQEETDAMRLGSAVHMLALEPERFDSEYAIVEGPINPSTGKPYARDTKKFQVWLDQEMMQQTRKVLLASEFAESIEIAKAFQSHPTIAAIMASRAEKFFEFEHVDDFKWEGLDEWVRIKCKLDFVMPSEGIIVDLKTTDNPSEYEWSWSAGSYGYHRQAAIYMDVMEAKYNRPFRFIFGVVRSKAPYEAHCYEPDDESISEGREEYRELAKQWQDRMAKGDWFEVSQKEVTTIRIRTRRRR